jgi:hypothetical protein
VANEGSAVTQLRRVKQALLLNGFEKTEDLVIRLDLLIRE